MTESVLPGSAQSMDAAVYDLPGVQSRYARAADDGLLETHLLLHGISCGGCAGAIERGLNDLTGVREAEVNFSTHRAWVKWDESRVSLSKLLDTVRALGYDAQPYDPDAGERAFTAARRAGLRRIVVAAALGMQVMMMTVALYAGADDDLSSRFGELFRWLSLVLTGAIMAYPAVPFFSGALRDLKACRAGMDVPVSLGLLMAYGASAINTVTGVGEVYFESVAMFVLVLLIARFLQSEAGRKTAFTREAIASAMPASAECLDATGHTSTRVPVEALVPGDRVRVLPGETVPTDGRLLSAHAWFSEALLSGESTMVERGAGDRVLGGAINQRNPVEIEIESTVHGSYLSRLLELSRKTAAQKPKVAQLADRIAGWFIAGVLLLAAVVALVWLQLDPERWLPITISVLVVTCPCALSLATPTAVTAAIGALARDGIVVADVQALERLSTADRFLFDKTGTLTRGEFKLEATHVFGAVSKAGCLRIAAALEQHSEHPVGRSLLRAFDGELPTLDDALRVVPGSGVSGCWRGQTYWLGSAVFIEQSTAAALPDTGESSKTSVWLATANTVLCRFVLDDSVRPHAKTLLSLLTCQGRGIEILSGDHRSVVARLAGALGVERWRAGCRPEDKAAYIGELVDKGHQVVMIGDGLNDTLASAGATVSVAMGGGTDAIRAGADVIVVGNDLGRFAQALRFVPRVKRVIVQNLVWALVYNLVALPCAAAGLVAPWMAATGMSLSSVLVVANSARLLRQRKA